MRPLLALLLALTLAAPAAAPAAAQELLASYTAHIAPADLQNSRGQRLTEPWQVLRQDRANFHRFGIRQFADEYDPIFLSLGARSQMQALLAAGRIDRETRRALLRGDVIVQVEVWGLGRSLRSVDVRVRQP